MEAVVRGNPLLLVPSDVEVVLLEKPETLGLYQTSQCKACQYCRAGFLCTVPAPCSCLLMVQITGLAGALHSSLPA